MNTSYYYLPLAAGIAIFSLFGNFVNRPARADLIQSNLPIAIAQATTDRTFVSGENGQYQATILVNASSAAVWAVLTDYNNFNQFIPNVISSQLIESNGDIKIIEQISERILLGLPIQTIIRTENREIYQQEINFTLISGDLSKLQGYWKIEPVVNETGLAQVLLTHQVEAQPPSGIPPAIFYDIFKNSLAPTLNAIRQQAEAQ